MAQTLRAFRAPGLPGVSVPSVLKTLRAFRVCSGSAFFAG